MEHDLTIPDFLDVRKTGRKTPPLPKETAAKVPTMKTRLTVAERLAAARCEGTRILIEEQEAERKAAAKLRIKNGVPVQLNTRVENCPLTPGRHEVELIKLGRKWVRFRCEGRVNAVKVRRVIWDAMTEAAK